jgi:3',5'-cyclic AMP phosphodiesterase CpdA
MPQGPSTRSVRLVHFSDVHVTARPLGWQARDWLTKRVTGWLNLYVLGRGYSFRHADVPLAELAAQLSRQPPDHVIFSGDASTLGFDNELARMAYLLHVAEIPGLAAPGNHDYYTSTAAGSGLFERYFAPWQKGERIDNALYPFAQRVGHVWLVAVNSSTANYWFWDSSGVVDRAQLDRLERLLAHLGAGLRILVTHYPVCLASGKPESRAHGLRNADDVVAVAARGGICLWLHGHRHRAYYLPRSSQLPFPVICAGSLTHRSHGSYGEYTITDGYLEAVVRAFSPSTLRFYERQRYGLELT